MRVRSIYLKTRFRKKSMITNLLLLSRLKSSQNPRYRNYTSIHMWRSVKEESEIKRRSGIPDYRQSNWMNMILKWFSIHSLKTVIFKNKKLETNLHMIWFTRIHHETIKIQMLEGLCFWISSITWMIHDGSGFQIDACGMALLIWIEGWIVPLLPILSARSVWDELCRSQWQ